MGALRPLPRLVRNKVWKRGAAASSPAPGPGPTPTPTGTLTDLIFPALFTPTPTPVTATLVPHAADATTVTGNPFESLNAAGGSNYALGSGDFNQNFLGPKAPPGGTGSEPWYQLSVAAASEASPATFFAADRTLTTVGRFVVLQGGKHVRFRNLRFTDKNALTASYGAPSSLVPSLLSYDLGSAGTAVVQNCLFRGKPDLTTGVDSANLPFGFDCVGTAAKITVEDCIFHACRQSRYPAAAQVFIRRNFIIGAADMNIYWMPGNGSILEENFQISTTANAGAIHNNFIRTEGRQTSSSTTGDTVRRNGVIRTQLLSTNQGIAFQGGSSPGPGNFTVSGSLWENNFSINGGQDDMNVFDLINSEIRGHLSITEKVYLDAAETPGIRLTRCGNVNVHHCIFETFSEVSPRSTNTFANNVALSKTLSAGQTGTNSFPGTNGTTYSHDDAFFNPLYGAGKLNGVDVTSRTALITWFRQNWRPKLNGPLKMADGSYSGPLLPNGSWNDFLPYYGGQTFAG